MRVRRLFALLLVMAALLGAAFITRPYIHGLSFVIRAAEMQGTARRVADLDTTRVTEREIAIPTAPRSDAARVCTSRLARTRARRC